MHSESKSESVTSSADLAQLKVDKKRVHMLERKVKLALGLFFLCSSKEHVFSQL